MNEAEVTGVIAIAIIAWAVVAQAHAEKVAAANATSSATGFRLAPVTIGPNVGYRAAEVGGNDFFQGAY